MSDDSYNERRYLDKDNYPEYDDKKESCRKSFFAKLSSESWITEASCLIDIERRGFDFTISMVVAELS